MKHSFTTSDGIRLAYYIDDYTDPWKSGPTLLMLHSAMSSSKRFYSMVPGLANHYRVIRLDSRGHGESEVPPPHAPHSRERLNQDVLELLDRLGIESTHILGGSAGGYTAQLLAIHHPRRVKSLVLLSATPGGPPAVLASSRRQGRQLSVKMLQPLTVPAGRVAQLWALPKDGAPFPVAVVPAGVAQGKSVALALSDTSEKLFFTVPRLGLSLEAAPAKPGDAPSGDFVLSGPCVKLW